MSSKAVTNSVQKMLQNPCKMANPLKFCYAWFHGGPCEGEHYIAYRDEKPHTIQKCNGTLPGALVAGDARLIRVFERRLIKEYHKYEFTTRTSRRLAKMLPGVVGPPGSRRYSRHPSWGTDEYKRFYEYKGTEQNYDNPFVIKELEELIDEKT